jgi:hypothetical protein
MLSEYDPVHVLVAGIVLAYVISFLFKKLCAALKYCKNFRANVMISVFNFAIWLPCGRYYI